MGHIIYLTPMKVKKKRPVEKKVKISYNNEKYYRYKNDKTSNI
jgi:hypothetical protein